MDNPNGGEASRDEAVGVETESEAVSQSDSQPESPPRDQPRSETETEPKPDPRSPAPSDTDEKLKAALAGSGKPSAKGQGGAGRPSKKGSTKGRPKDPRDTPAMRQHQAFKRQHPECVLFFRMGDFYEMFDDDARLVSKVLGLTLTQRTEGVPMAGIPYHAVEGYLRRLIQAGYRVAVCDQIQDPKEAKGVVDRAVTRVLTPGTLVDDTLLDEGRPNVVAAVMFTESGDDSAAVVAWAEVSTGRFELFEANGADVAAEIARLGPSELLYVETADGVAPPRVERLKEAAGCPLTARPTWTFRQRDAIDTVLEQYGVATLEGFGLLEDDPAIGPAGALIRYLQETQAPGASAEDGRLGHLRPPKRQSCGGSLMIDAASLRSLEIERTMRAGQVEGSLLSVLQRCVTPMGKRLLRHWLCYPLVDRSAIEARQQVVAGLVRDVDLGRELCGQLDGVQDIARIVGRVSMRRASPRDMVALGKGVDRIGRLIESLEGTPALEAYVQRLRAIERAIAPLAVSIGETCVDHPPANLREGGVIRDGVDAALDEARTLQTDAGTWLANYQKELVESSGIPSLKVGFNKVFGYYIEITHIHAAKVPEAFTRKQTLKNAERYVTPELKRFEEKVTTAEQRALDRERIVFERLCGEAARAADDCLEYADAVAELDVLSCFAETARRFGYVRPEIVDEPVLEIRQGRHPVLDRMLSERFVPNDCVLGVGGDSSGEGRKTLALITGPNMAGKSTVIRQAAILTLMAHTGSFVPAEKATIGLTDRIFTRIGASDELHAGQSTFMVEMVETANILHHATEKSLVVLDEIGRGTSTLDGLALAWSIAEFIAARGCRTLFATHYHELTQIADRLPNVANLHVSVREWEGEIVFLYQLQPGATGQSFGVHVARIAGLPKATIERAAELLKTLVVHTDLHDLTPALPNKAKPSVRADESPQLPLFQMYLEHPVIEAMKTVSLDELSPLEAFDLLREWVRDVRET